MRRKLWFRVLWYSIVVGLLVYLCLYALIAHRAYQLLGQGNSSSDAVLVLGSRAYLNGAPNPCLTGRVDKAVALAQSGLAPRIIVSGGVDSEDGRIEAEVMAAHARAQNYAGEVLLEQRSTSTIENLRYTEPLLQNIAAKKIIIVSEPYHAWRVERLVRANSAYDVFQVEYAAAPTYCWNQWGMVFKGALREPLAVVNNFTKGYFKYDGDI